MLVSSALREAHEVVSVVLHTDKPGIWEDSKSLLTYGLIKVGCPVASIVTVPTRLQRRMSQRERETRHTSLHRSQTSKDLCAMQAELQSSGVAGVTESMSGSAPYAQQARLSTCSESNSHGFCRQMDAEGSNLEIGNTPCIAVRAALRVNITSRLNFDLEDQSSFQPQS